MKLEKKRVYYHLCCVGRWKEIFYPMIDRLNPDWEVHVVSVGPDRPFPSSKYILRRCIDDVSRFERPTLELIQRDKYKGPFLYLHSKGVTKKNKVLQRNVASWVEYMLHFLVDKSDECMFHLENGWGAVGVNLRTDPKLHFSGNFWWSTGEHVCKLGKISFDYHGPEMWIGQSGRLKSVWQSGVDHYRVDYCKKFYGHRVQIL